jgi:hypothetical protein
MQKMNASEFLKYKIEELEYEINDDFIIIKDSFIHMNIQLSSLNIIKYTSYIVINAWLPQKGKQLIALAYNIFKVIIK